MPYRPENSNKGTFGKILNLSGSKNYIGASFLSTVASLKTGAGLIALASTKEVISSVSKLLPEAVYLSRKDGLKNLKNYTVFLIGCGLGTDRASVSIFKSYIKELANSDCPVLIDADGLNILARNDKIKLPQKLVITPHPAECARLLGITVEEVLSDLRKSAINLSEKYHCVAVLKTHRTIICEREKLFINECGNSALAKAGTGDVLSGIISGLLAQNMEPFEASKLGVFLHAKSGELASADLTEYCVMASDLIDYLPKAIKAL